MRRIELNTVLRHDLISKLERLNKVLLRHLEMLFQMQHSLPSLELQSLKTIEIPKQFLEIMSLSTTYNRQ